MAAILLLTMVVVSAQAQQTWKEVRSRNFSVVTDAGERQGCAVARRLEQFASVLGVLTGQTERREPAPVQIVLFRRGSELRRFAPLHEGKPVPAAAVFVWSSEQNYIGLDASSHNFWDNVGHEYTHAQLLGTPSEMRLWFDEGFAQFYSTAKLEGGRVRIGSAPKGAAAALRFKKLWPVEYLFAVTVDSPEYAEPKLRPFFYAQAWLLVHMLVMQDKLDQVRTYASLQSQGVGIVESLNRAFHLTPEQLDLALEQYRQHLSVRMVPVPATAQEVSCSKRGLGSIEVTTFLAEFHAHEPGYEEIAATEFEAILRHDPGNSRAHAGLGFLAFRRGDWDSAWHHYEQAVQRDPSNARAVYYQIFLQRIAGDSPEAEDAFKVRDQLEQVVQAEPGLADAHALLAWAQAAAGDLEAATRSLETAVHLAPRADAYLARLADLYSRTGRTEEARSALARAATSVAPEIRDEAQQLARKVADSEGSRGPLEKPPSKVPESAAGWVGSHPPTVPGNGQETSVALDPREIQYAHGRLLESDCSLWPSVRMKMLIAGQEWVVEVHDATRLPLINADAFSCSWANREVTLNFRWRGGLVADAVSLELGNIP